jgi:CubicO group peptidase (beta-lactamase class C family)
VATAAVAVVDPDGVVASIGPDGTLPWASVTKLISALTVLVAVRDGVVALDEPAGPPGSTVRHLLAHASGLSPDDNTVLSPPRRRRIYSNRGYEVLADTVSARAGTDFADLVDQTVLEPLGMTATRLDGALVWADIPSSDPEASRALSIRAPNQRSTWSIQEEPVGVKCMWKRG